MHPSLRICQIHVMNEARDHDKAQPCSRIMLDLAISDGVPA